MQFGVSETLAHWTRYRPDHSAVISGTDTITYSVLGARCDSLAASLRHCPFERVGIAVHRKLDYLAALIAVLRAGKSVVALNLALGEEVLRVNIADVGLQALIHDHAHAAKLDLLPSGQSWALDLSDHRYDVAPQVNAPLAHVSGPTDEFGVFFSSGTTGIPKGIERDHYSVVVELLGWCLEMRLGRDDAFYIGRPVYYTGGLVLTLCTLLTGGTVILNDYQDDGDWDEVWQDYQSALSICPATYAFFLPDQVRHFVRCSRRQPSQKRTARCLLLMGAPVTGQEKLLFAETFECDILESWGNSESLGTITERNDLATRPDSIGRPFLTDELYVVRDDLEFAAPRELGRLAGAEEAGFRQYSNRPSDTQSVKQHGLIVSDDLGYVDEDGYFYVEGRHQERILTTEGSLFLPAIEDRLNAHPTIREACVVGIPAPNGLTEIVAAVVLAEQNEHVEDSDLHAALAKEVAELCQLSRVVVVAALPRVAAGKVDRAAAMRLIEPNLST